MASPQKENGYTAIANELLEAMIEAFAELNSSECRIFLAIIRKTYGYSKKSDKISFSQLEKITNLSRRSVIYGTQSLEAKGMIKAKKREYQPTEYSVVKDYDAWVVQSIAPQVHKNWCSAKDCTSAKKGHKVVQTDCTSSSANTLHPQKKIKTNKNNRATPKKKTLNIYKFFMGQQPLTDEGDIVYEYEGAPKTPKKYKSKQKLYARIAVMYMRMKGEEGNALRYFPDIKELVEKTEKALTADGLAINEINVMSSIKFRLEKANEKYGKQNLDWSLNAVIKNFNSLLK